LANCSVWPWELFRTLNSEGRIQSRAAHYRFHWFDSGLKFTCSGLRLSAPSSRCSISAPPPIQSWGGGQPSPKRRRHQIEIHRHQLSPPIAVPHGALPLGRGSRDGPRCWKHVSFHGHAAPAGELGEGLYSLARWRHGAEVENTLLLALLTF
jgi:hypothetical protein